jgi:hypothetical protein
MDPIREAAVAYREGRVRSAVVSYAASGVGFDRQLEDLISRRVDREGRLLLRASSRARSRALSSARAGRLAMAREAVNESRRIQMDRSLSREVRLIITAFQDAVEAYLEYKWRHFEMARELLFEALRVDRVLIHRYGYNILELHRIQIGHNFMRLAIGRGDADQAAELCAHLLAYTQGGADRWPFSEAGHGGVPGDLPLELVSAMFVQLASELALLLASQPAERGRALLAPAVALAGTGTVTRSELQGRVYDWLEIKFAYVQGDFETFLQKVSRLLTGGPGETPLLWRATVTDLHDLCRACSLDGAVQLADEIARDAATWRPTPPLVLMRHFKAAA